MHKIVSFLEILLVLFVIITSGSPIGTIYYNFIVILFAVFGTGMNIFKVCKKNEHGNITIKKEPFYFLLFLYASLGMSLLSNFDWDIAHYFGLAIYYFDSYLVVNYFSYKKYKEYYINIIFVICAYSIVLTVLCNTSKRFAASLPIISYNTAGTWSHFNYIYYIWGGFSSVWTTVVRNSGLFREPGVFSFHIVLALLLLLSDEKLFRRNNKINIVRFSFFILAGLSTLSTVGVIGMALAVVIYMVKNKRPQILQYVIVVILTVVVLNFVSKNQTILFAKLNSSNTNFVSVTDRTNGIVSALKTWSQNIPFGKGYSCFQANKVGVSTFFLVDLGGKYGLFFVGIICYGVLKFIKKNSSNLIIYILCFSIVALFLFTQGFADAPAFMVLEMFALIKDSRRAMYENSSPCYRG